MKQLAVILVLVLSARLAHGGDSKEEAKEHVARATELHKDGKFREALDELKTAYALDPNPTLLYAMGQMYVSVGECAQAIAFYQRFIASKPNPAAAALANEAIETCKTNPPPVTDTPHEDTPPPVIATPPPTTTVVTPLPPRPAAAPAPRPWYGDHIADALVVSGVAAGVVGIVVYRSAVGDRDRADTATSYDSYVSLIDSAHAKRGVAIGFGAGGAALAIGGVLHFVLVGRGASDHGVQIQPTPSGGAVSWTGRF
jgi:tetratricopeptide (TPR) repeat protein